MLNLFHDQFERIYGTARAAPAEKANLARAHASEQEDNVYKNSTKNTYKNIAAQALSRLKKRLPVQDLLQGGTNEEMESRRLADEKRAKLRLNPEELAKYTLATLDGWQKDYIIDVPSDNLTDQQPTDTGKVKTCKRCKSEFIVSVELSADDRKACLFHWGRMVTDTANGPRRRIYACCRSAGEPCTRGPHVFEETLAEELHAKVPFAATKDISKAKIAQTAVALDCEMIYTTRGLSLARLTAVAPTGDAILDEHVRQAPATVIDCNTRFSGVTPESLDSAVFDVSGAREALCSLIDEHTFLIGHGLENDLKAMRLVHPPDRIIDTAMLFRNAQGYRMGLRVLTKMHLKKFTQDQGYHDSKEDSVNALDLLRWKIEQDRLQRV